MLPRLAMVLAILLPLVTSRPAAIPVQFEQSAEGPTTNYPVCRKGRGTGYAHYSGWKLVGDDVSYSAVSCRGQADLLEKAVGSCACLARISMY